MRCRPGPFDRTSRRRAVAVALLAVASPACVSLPSPPAGLAAASPAFVPERFFAGRTEGDGVLAVVARRARAVHVLGNGQVAADGTLLLSQSVTAAGKPATRRQWRIRRTAPGRYAGTLSDAAGPITGEVAGNMLRLHFRMAGGLAAEQRLYLRPDGRTAINRMTVRRFGIVVAVLNETIRKID